MTPTEKVMPRTGLGYGDQGAQPGSTNGASGLSGTLSNTRMHVGLSSTLAPLLARRRNCRRADAQSIFEVAAEGALDLATQLRTFFGIDCAASVNG